MHFATCCISFTVRIFIEEIIPPNYLLGKEFNQLHKLIREHYSGELDKTIKPVAKLKSEKTIKPVAKLKSEKNKQSHVQYCLKCGHKCQHDSYTGNN